jgi:hypothetical protein
MLFFVYEECIGFSLQGGGEIRHRDSQGRASGFLNAYTIIVILLVKNGVLYI